MEGNERDVFTFLITLVSIGPDATQHGINKTKALLEGVSLTYPILLM